MYNQFDGVLQLTSSVISIQFITLLVVPIKLFFQLFVVPVNRDSQI